jgi:ElaB/YqjD/DUF883 family membrane-anchored ribosome-binding protein
MTTSDPDQIRRRIAETQRDLSADGDALTEKVSPGRVVGRRVERARDVMTSAKERIMGTADSATSTVGDTTSGTTDRVSSAASSTAEAVGSAPRAVRRRAEGNPLAAGLVAFGLGWLISSLLPPTRAEQELAGQARQVAAEKLQPVAEQARQAASEVADHLREPAQRAVESVRSTAGDAASTVTDEGRAAADHVTTRTDQARGNVQDQVRG